MVCTEPLPKLRVPRMVARWRSCSAPATISEAEAEAPLTSTITGTPRKRSPSAWRGVGLVFAGRAAMRRDDDAAIEEIAGDAHRGVEQTAGIVAQIEHEAVEAAAGFALHLVERIDELALRLLGEGADANIADATGLEMRLDRGDTDDRAGQRHVERTLTQTQDHHAHFGAGRSAQLIDRILQGHAIGRMAVDAQNDVAWLEAGARRRRVVDRRDDLGMALVARQLGADAGELAMAVGEHLAVFVLVHIVGMRIEPGEHALEAVLHQMIVIDRLDIARMDAIHHAAVKRQIGIAGCRHRRAAANEREKKRRPCGSANMKGGGHRAITFCWRHW